jgi:hypothetical protein
MSKPRYTDRRTVLKLAGAGIVGGTTLVDSASAHEVKSPAIEPVWGDDNIWELLDSEPRDRHRDSEGDEMAHEPLYLIAPVMDSTVDGSNHSPQQPAGVHFPVAHDHVVPVPGEADDQFSAQWHVKLVTGGEGMTDLVNQDQGGNYLTKASRIESATNVTIIETPEVFTCPVRPHHDPG